MKFSIIAATQGRDTLPRMIRSCHQRVDAEIIICADTLDPLLSDVQSICEREGARYIEYNAGFHDYGHPQAQVGMEAATGSYVLFLGDDDVLESDALSLLNDVLPDDNSKVLPHLFRIWMYPSQSRQIKNPIMLGRSPFLQYGRISAQNIVAPNIPEKLGYWEHDFIFIAQTIDKHGGVVWREEIIARCY